MKNIRLLFLCGIVSGLILRLLGINCGLPYLYYPDEVRQILDALSMAQRVSIVPLDLTYPALHKHLLLGLYGIYYIFERLIDFSYSPFKFALAFLQNPSILFLLGRLFSVLFGIGVGLVIYKLGKVVFGKKAAFLATMFSLFMYQLIGHSQWAVADIMVTFLTITAFCYIFLDMTFFRNRYFYLACISMGLCVSTKPQGAFIIVPLVVAQIYLMSEKKSIIGWFLKRYTVGAILILLFSSLGNIAFFYNPIAYIQKAKVLSTVIKIGLSSTPTYNDGFFGLLWWFSRQIVRQEMLLGVFILFGIVVSLLRHDKYDVVYLSYLLLIFFLLRDWGFRYLHLFTAAFGVMCLLAGRSVSDLLERARNKVIKRVVYSLILVAFILSAWRGVDAGFRKIHNDTRIESKDWIEENIPPGSRIGIDWYGFGPPIFGDIPVIMYNTPITYKFYQDRVPTLIKSGYDRFLNENPKLTRYEIISLMYATPEPNWPKDMSEEARKKAEKIEFFREVYSWFNFMTLDEIKEHNIEYIVISSYSYSHFLLDDDRRKTGLFNPYIFEDTVSSNRQVESYDDKTLNGLLFFLISRARNFYLKFLDEGKDVHLMREFVPGPKQLGPVIKIYKLEG